MAVHKKTPARSRKRWTEAELTERRRNQTRMNHKVQLPKRGLARAGRHKYAGMTIHKLTATGENPRRPGTKGFEDWRLLRDGMRYETYVARGGRREHLEWNIMHGWVEVRPEGK